MQAAITKKNIKKLVLLTGTKIFSPGINFITAVYIMKVSLVFNKKNPVPIKSERDRICNKELSYI
jgi:hypothetical protein